PTFGSNMILVAPERSATAGALLYGGPQVGYSVPALFWEADVDVAGARWHLFHVPATGLSIGRFGSVAFSATVGYGDQTDLVLLPLDPADPAQYRWGDGSRPFALRSERFTVLDRAGTVGALAGLDPLGLARKAADAPPTVVELVVRDSHVGPVVAYDAASGFAVAAQRAHRGEETGILDFYLDEELPGISQDAARMRPRFDAAMSTLGVSFNIFAAFDDGAIVYRETGRVPARSAAFDPRLPLPAVSEAEWTERWDWACMPGIVDPARGWLVNWNNVPQRGWPNMAAEPWIWGGDHRVAALEEAVAAAVAAGPVGLDDLNTAVRKAGTRDAVAARVLPRLLDAAGATGPEAEAMRAWAVAGAPIVDADGDGNVDDPGVHVYETWRPLVEDAVFGDELGDLAREFHWAEDILGSNTDAHGTGGESVLVALLDGGTRADWWDDVRTPARETPRGVLAPTLDGLHDTVGDPSAWRRPMNAHVYEKLGAGPDAAMPQVNRGSIGLLADMSRPGLRTVLTPGESGHVTAAAGAGLEPPPAHALDQLGMYVAWEYKEYS
ncbi:MAG TPA: penicillin acylase family protein, partial [Candidatus Thermoplasmatota archaeon]|nr:penicillin acylase family protein [Candidatus Thermoplasmatota archaeon]